MAGANAIVRKVHASVPGIVIEEDEHVIKMIANPSFMPKGFPSAHIEVFDKSHKTAPVWLPRRDLKLVSVWHTAQQGTARHRRAPQITAGHSQSECSTARHSTAQCNSLSWADT
jgi:hypothetical protein